MWRESWEQTPTLPLPLLGLLRVLPWGSHGPLMPPVQVGPRLPAMHTAGREGGGHLQGHMEDIRHILK